jgi:NAD(P)-dependent dehydrogenase (short-subunit alcohol dehydrogenase family)
MPEPARYQNRLAGKVALVTGAGSQGMSAGKVGTGYGTGKAIATLFAREGASLGLLDIDAGRVAETRSLVETAKSRAVVVVGDATDEAVARHFVDETAAAFGRIDILVNNLGISAAGGRLEALEPAEWQRVIDVNLRSAMLVTRSAIPHLVGAGGSAIVNIASVAGMQAFGSSAYGASKAAMIQFSRDCALAYGRDGVRVNTIAPGHLFTPMVRELLKGDGARVRRAISPLGIEGDAWDVARAALFLVSEDARFITGICLPVDGGVTQVGGLEALKLANG